MKKYAMGGSMTTTTQTTKKPVKKAKKTNEQNWGGEMGRAPFTTKENTERRKNLGLPTSKAEEKAYYEKMRREEEVISKSKNGKTMKKAKNGTSLGMKSVKAGYDKNPGVTRADIIVAGKKQAKKGTTVKKAQMGASVISKMAKKNQTSAPKVPKRLSTIKRPDDSMKSTTRTTMKSGGKMKKCRYGCK
jgi:hypothetical protein